jgi:hypothetical protein
MKEKLLFDDENDEEQLPPAPKCIRKQKQEHFTAQDNRDLTKILRLFKTGSKLPKKLLRKVKKNSKLKKLLRTVQMNVFKKGENLKKAR